MILMNIPLAVYNFEIWKRVGDTHDEHSLHGQRRELDA